MKSLAFRYSLCARRICLMYSYPATAVTAINTPKITAIVRSTVMCSLRDLLVTQP